MEEKLIKMASRDKEFSGVSLVGPIHAQRAADKGYLVFCINSKYLSIVVAAPDWTAADILAKGTMVGQGGVENLSNIFTNVDWAYHSDQVSKVMYFVYTKRK